jgi:hypothetical protein
LLSDHFGADQVVQQLRALVVREIARGLANAAARVEVEEVTADDRAVHGGYGLGTVAIAHGCSTACCRSSSLRLAGGEPGDQSGKREGAKIFHAEYSVGYVW